MLYTRGSYLKTVQFIHRMGFIGNGFHKSATNCKKNPRKLKGKKITAQNWLRRQINDPYSSQARTDMYRCRSAYKLIQIDDRFRIFKYGDTVVDCGAAPGSWSQVLVQRVNSDGLERDQPIGQVISVDLQDMNPLDGCITLSKSDFTSVDTQKKIKDILKGAKADAVVSDMAPNACGLKDLDHDNIIDLCVSVLDFSYPVLKENGVLLCKLWQGSRQSYLESLLKRSFSSVKLVKPKASRDDSAEIYLLARNFIGQHL